ncbi:RhuM family protein [Faecalicoccus pleomorphus]|uniref:RhuM family protein n=1 Tax=Faecalicoccus pleomorphus TaxID=1323 RepID=A0AAW6CYC1_9FIRM|nr:RhuM family protein [Faecalicoccus pleomorphus]MDB7980270.1 RhuM family protein [Faecalicoccus pleomorphus]MDB7982604.1 RhuM family protein [Faecalicoccus pleomorphus]MDB7985378.1 RhuM family protein [Faecalicoccus pleomorphus]
MVFKNGELELEVNVTPEKDTVWLTQDQMSTLFDTARFSIAYHISNIFKEGELNKETSVEIFDRSLNKASRPPMYSNLDVIISVGYHVKSQRGIAFRKWATSILKDYMLKGYAVNKKRLKVLNKTIEIQSRMLATAYELDEKELLDVIEAYQNTLSLLDDYDHGSLSKLEGTDFIYRLTYEECRELIDKMKFESDVFGVEKEKGKLNGILAAVYQNIFGQELYPSVEEKASNLLYFLIKDHPFADGCKRIGVTIFLEFLNKNHHLIIDGKQIISDSALVAITLMIAESRPEEKETMVKLVMNFLVKN